MRMQSINLLNGWKSFPRGRTRTETNKNKSSYSKFLDALHSVTNCPRFSAGIFSVSVDNQQPILGKKRRTCLQCRRFLLYKKGVIFIRNISLTFWYVNYLFLIDLYWLYSMIPPHRSLSHLVMKNILHYLAESQWRSTQKKLIPLILQPFSTTL